MIVVLHALLKTRFNSWIILIFVLIKMGQFFLGQVFCAFVILLNKKTLNGCTNGSFLEGSIKE